MVYSTRAMLPSAKKDSVPTTQKSCVVYEFSCRCEARYVGRTTQRLADRIKQHVPTSIRKKSNTVKPWPNDANIYPNKCQHCWVLLDVGWPNEPNITTQHLSAYHSNACSYLGPRLLNFLGETCKNLVLLLSYSNNE